MKRELGIEGVLIQKRQGLVAEASSSGSTQDLAVRHNGGLAPVLLHSLENFGAAIHGIWSFGCMQPNRLQGIPHHKGRLKVH